MPIYEYACRKCGQEFEHLTSGSEKPECPKCESRSVEKKLSVFATSNGDGASSAGADLPEACRNCGDPRGPGACGMN